MSAFPKYDSYKDSEVEWLGAIPSHWEVVRAKRVFRDVSEKNHPEAQLLSVTQNIGVVPRDELEQRVVMPTGQLQTFKLVRKDDFVISLRSFQGGIEYSEYTGLISPAYTVLRKQRDVHSGYLKYLLKSAGFISELNTTVTGIRQGKNIDFKELSYSYLPIPNSDEQERIANFLDQITAEIDAAIAKKQRLIELLKEQKTILINQAVTKGLNPNVPMRDSGVEWIGEIPEHWRIHPLGSFLKFISYGFTNPMPTEDHGPYMLTSNDIGDGVLKLNDARRTSEKAYRARLTEKSKPVSRDILVTKDGTLGRTAVVRSNEEMCISQSVALLRPKDHVLEGYLETCLRSNTYQEKMVFDAGGTTIKHIYISRLVKMRIATPPDSEQKAICEYCDGIEKSADSVIDKVNKEIELLTEYKSVVVSNAVTGKIKI